MKNLLPGRVVSRSARRLSRDTSGLALLEFALSLPIVMGLGAYGLEISNQALIHVRISQIALSLADNASRVGVYSTLNAQQIREVDVNDVLQAARLQGANINLTTNGRIILSSLENIKQSYDTTYVQRIHWQRCIGLKSGAGYDSRYTTAITDGTTATAADDGTVAASGMGDGNTSVNAPQDSGVMFVEINYLTKPLFGTWLTSPVQIRYIASFIVRDKRLYDQIYNPSPTATRSTCNLYTS